MNTTNTKNYLCIKDFIPTYPLLEDENLNYDLYSKKEFYNLKDVDQLQDDQEKKGDYWNAQKTIQRFLSPFTPYNELLLFGKPGAGKTCASIAVSEMNKMEPLLKKPILIVVPNETLVNQWKNEIAFTCTNGIYVPENYYSKEAGKRLTALEKTIRMGKKIGVYYQVTTIEKFRRDVDRLDDTTVHRIFSNKLIIVDEAHTLRIQSNTTSEKIKESQSRYQSYHRLFHLVENTKILLLTGTPMVDRSEEIASLMNLILPLDKQLPTRNRFVEKFIKTLSDKDIEVQNTRLLREYMHGRISYIGESGDFPKRIDIGNHDYTKYIKLYNIDMSVIQANGVKKAYKKDIEEREDVSLFRNSRQALGFVFYHNNQYYWGDEASNLLMRKVTSQYMLDNKLIKYERYEIKKEFREDLLQNLRVYSCKYAEIIEQLKNNPTQMMFCFTPLKTGAGGAIFLSALLSLFGYNRFTGRVKKPNKRHAIITGDEKSEKQRSIIFKTLNSVENQKGELCQILIGTMAISVGNNLTNVQKEFVLSPYWNNSTIEQGIGRGIRPSSLLWKKNERQVEVYQMCAVSKLVDSIHNMDIRLYKMSENKDISIKKIERQMKINAWDCALQYERNMLGVDNDFSRSCDYSKCNYTCYGIPFKEENGQYIYELKESELDETTYLLYYSGKEINRIKKEIKEIIKKYNKIDINELQTKINVSSFKLIILAIDSLFETNEIVYNSLGQKGFLKKDNNILYISELSHSTKYQDSWYVEHPYINKQIALDEFVLNDILEQDMKKIETISTETINNLHIETKIFLVEYLLSLPSEALTEKQKQTRQYLMSVFADNIYYLEKDDILVHDLMKIKQDLPYVDGNKGENGNYRCMLLTEGAWRDCNRTRTEEVAKRVAKIKDKRIEDISKNPYQMFAIITDAAFKIVDKTKEKPKSKTDRRTMYRGKNCTAGWKKNELIQLAVRMRLTIDNDFETLSKKDLLSKLEVNNIQDIPSDMNVKELSTLYALTKLKNAGICRYLRKWFEDNDLVIYE